VEGVVDGRPVRLVKPQTYMNRSGAALAPLRLLSGFDPATHLLILSDDVALPAGRFRIRGAGSAGGHNGLKSIEAALVDLAGFVLSPPGPDDQAAIDGLLDVMAQAVDCWLAEGVEQAMSRFNR
jgi:PTH1 family peptidyl-tRNA hydrolase